MLMLSEREMVLNRGALSRLAARLSGYEQQYGMTSHKFYRRFRSGELGDDMDLVEWSIFWEMYQATGNLGPQG